MWRRTPTRRSRPPYPPEIGQALEFGGESDYIGGWWLLAGDWY